MKAERVGEGSVLLGLRVSPEAHPDLRGFVQETYRQSWFPEYVPPIKQLVQSESDPGVLRGMHLHKKQWDIWRFVWGKAIVRLYDTATDDNAVIPMGQGDVLAIPPGISHGFYTERGCILMYALTEEYDGSDEYGWWPFSGLAPDAWPKSHAGLVMSERDLRAPRLEEFAA